LVVIGLLDAAIAAEILAVRRDDPATAALLVPYLGWSAYATALNLAVSEPGDASP
jgi:benzodiazapine receptor